jgi:hypothetical protein
VTPLHVGDAVSEESESEHSERRTGAGGHQPPRGRKGPFNPLGEEHRG